MRFTGSLLRTGIKQNQSSAITTACSPDNIRERPRQGIELVKCFFVTGFQWDRHVINFISQERNRNWFILFRHAFISKLRNQLASLVKKIAQYKRTCATFCYYLTLFCSVLTNFTFGFIINIQ